MMNMTTMIENMDTDMDPVDEVLLEKVYWAAVGAVIAAFTLGNLYTRYLAWHRSVHRSDSYCVAGLTSSQAEVERSHSSKAESIHHRLLGRRYGHIP